MAAASRSDACRKAASSSTPSASRVAASRQLENFIVACLAKVAAAFIAW